MAKVAVFQATTLAAPEAAAWVAVLAAEEEKLAGGGGVEVIGVSAMTGMMDSTLYFEPFGFWEGVLPVILGFLSSSSRTFHRRFTASGVFFALPEKMSLGSSFCP